MPRNKAARPSPRVIIQENVATATGARDYGIRLIGHLLDWAVGLAVEYTMVRYRRLDCQILGAIISPIFIYVMRLFAFAKWATELLHSYQVMLVGIAMGQPQRVARRDPNENIPMGTDCAAAFPVRVPGAATPLITARSARKGCRLLGAATFWARRFIIHNAFSITHGLLPVKKGGGNNANEDILD